MIHIFVIVYKVLMVNIFFFVESIYLSSFVKRSIKIYFFLVSSSYNHHNSAITLLNVRQEQMQALKQVQKQDYEIDLIDDNRKTLINQEKESPRKLAINDLSLNPIRSSWTLAKDDLDKTEPDTIMPHLSQNNFCLFIN